MGGSGIRRQGRIPLEVDSGVVAHSVPASVDQDWVPLIDVTDASLRDLFADADSNLARCVQRLVTSLDDPDGVIAAFGSFASLP